MTPLSRPAATPRAETRSPASLPARHAAAAPVLALAALLGVGTAQALPEIAWQERSAYVEVGHNGSFIASAQGDQSTAPNPNAVMAQIVTDTPVSLGLGFGMLQTGVMALPGGGLELTVVSFADLTAHARTPSTAYARGDVYFQAAITVTEDTFYTLNWINQSDPTGLPGVSGSEQFIAFNDPEGDGLLVAGQTVQLYGRVKHTWTVSDDQGERSLYPGMYTVLQLQPVPEPGTWALWLGGLAALGSVIRRRRAAR